jgi:hypothetical protein
VNTEKVSSFFYKNKALSLALFLLLLVPLMFFLAPRAKQPPIVSITPCEGSVFKVHENIVITVTARDVDGTIVKMGLYINETKIWEGAENTHDYAWLDVPEGRYVLKAFAYDNGGLIGTVQVSIGVYTIRNWQWYVSPNGTNSGDGSRENPWDLETALSQPDVVEPGDTIFLRGGTYRIEGTLESNLRGISIAPIVVRQYPGERAVIDTGDSWNNRIVVGGAYTWYWGFEIMSSATDRWGDPYTGNPVLERGYSMEVSDDNVPGIKFINLIIHDTGLNGIGFWTGAIDGEVYGCIIYNNGYDYEDRGHGHAIYTQNNRGVKRLIDNIMFNQYNYGIHAYTEQGYINNFYIEGNIAFNNGASSTISGYATNILVGGSKIAENITVINNYGYFAPTMSGGITCDLAYGKGCRNLFVIGNVFVDDAKGGTAFRVKSSNPTIVDNIFYGAFEDLSVPASIFPNNTFYKGTRPKGVWVFVRPNYYEPDRANIVVFNWELRDTVEVDISNVTGLQVGDRYEVRDVQNFFGPPIVSGRYAGDPITIPMNLVQVAQPIGTPARQLLHTAPEFGVFVLLKTNDG